MACRVMLVIVRSMSKHTNRLMRWTQRQVGRYDKTTEFQVPFYWCRGGCKCFAAAQGHAAAEAKLEELGH